MVIVSHDRALLDQLCTKIVETDMGVAQTFPGNYSEFVPAKAAWVEMQHMSWEKQQKEIARSEEIIQRLSSGANSGRATSAAKQLKIMQDEGQKVEKPFQRKPVMFRFPELKCSGKKVVEIKKLGYHHDVKAEALNQEKTVLQTVEEAVDDWRLNDIKALLGQCNFKAEMFDHKVLFLSGGEKEALREYKGTVIIASHDLYFLRQIMNRVVEAADYRLRDYSGDCNYYLEHNLEARQIELE